MMIDLDSDEEAAPTRPRRSLLQRSTVWLVVGMVLGGAATIAFMGQRKAVAGHNPPAPYPAAASSPGAPPPVGGLVIAVRDANASDAGTFVSSGPAELSASGRPRQWREEDATAKAPGAYQLTVVCAGEGQVSIEFATGAAQTSATLACSGPVARLGAVALNGKGTPTVVKLVATAGSVVVGYHVDHG